MNNKKTEAITWQAYEFKAHPKSPAWYIGFFIISLALIAYAIIWGGIITTITFVLLTIVTYLFAIKKPRKITHKITPSGISVGSVTYPYQNIKSFWIEYNPPTIKTLNFETTAYLNRYLKLELDEQDPVAIQKALSNYLPEDTQRQESVSERLLRKSKF